MGVILGSNHHREPSKKCQLHVKKFSTELFVTLKNEKQLTFKKSKLIVAGAYCELPEDSGTTQPEGAH